MEPYSQAPRAVPSTLWSQVLAAGQGSPPALEELAGRYLGPVYAYLRRSGHDRAEAEDATHGFFLFLLERNVLARAQPGRGRFRAFLFTCLRNFLANQADRRGALKRGGGRRELSLDVEGSEQLLELGRGDDPQRHFDRRWALEVVARATHRLQGELTPAAAAVFALAHGPEPLSHREIGLRQSMTEAAVAAAVYRARRRLRALLLEEVAATLPDPGEAEEELHDLMRALSGT